MKNYSMMIKPASSLCNLRCKYCFYCDIAANREIESFGIMTEDTVDSILNKVFEYFNNDEATITFAFQGGEPTVATLSYFEYFTSKVDSLKKGYHKVQYALQTNGTLLNEKWIGLFKKYKFLIGVSLDGYQGNNDSFRVDANQKGTFELIMKNINMLKENDIDFNILTVLTSELSKHPKELFDFYLENGFDYVQLIPCLPAFDDKEDKYMLHPKEFADFYNEFFRLWFNEFKKNHYMSITFFDNIIPMFKGVPPTQCGYLGFCSMQTIVEADGSIYPCDFYALDKYKIGNIKDIELVDIYKSNVIKEFINEEKRMSNRCNGCRYFNICKGQCKRLNICYFDKDYCGIEDFLSKNEKEILQIIQMIG